MNYFGSPHGGRPPSDEAVRAATLRYCRQELITMQSRPMDDADVKRFNEFYERIRKLFPPTRTPAAPEAGGSGRISRR